jgi:hypothetical protein
MEIYGWEIALGLIALALAISFVQGIIRELRGETFLPEDTFRDERINRCWRRDSDGVIEEAITIAGVLLLVLSVHR